MKKLYLFTLCSILSLTGYAQVIISESFDNGKISPEGWTFKISDVYTSETNSGEAIPAIKFGSSGQFVETPEFSGATNFSFWAKGNSTDDLSKLVIEFRSGENWYVLDSLSKIKAENTYEYILPDTARKLKITFIKSLGNVAFDDLKVYKPIIDNVPASYINNSPLIKTVSDTRSSVSVGLNKNGKIFYLVKEANISAPKFSDLEESGFIDVNKDEIATIEIKKLIPNTTYNLYLAKKGPAPNYPTDSLITKIEFKTKPKQPNLFFSKISKGTSNNRLIEIFNPRNETINLNEYRIAMSTNGAGWKTSYFSFNPHQKIKPKDVFVILKSTADSAIMPFSEADTITSSSVLTFTGNDAKALQKLNDDGIWEIIDLYGDPNSSTNFKIAGIPEAANKYNLKRKKFTRTGNTDWLISAGTDTLSSEWILVSLNNNQGIGSHAYWINFGLNFSEFTIEGQIGKSRIDTINHKIEVTIKSDINTEFLKCNYKLTEGANLLFDFNKPVNITEPLNVWLTSADTKDSTLWTISVLKSKAPQVTNVFYKGINIEIQFDKPIFASEKIKFGDHIPNIKLSYGTDCNHTLEFAARLDESKSKIIITHALLSSELDFICLKIDSIKDFEGNIYNGYTQKIMVNPTNAITLSENQEQIRIFPNPASSFFSIQYNKQVKTQLEIQLYSMDGKLILKKADIISNDKIELPNDLNGLYFVKISSNSFSSTKILSVKH